MRLYPFQCEQQHDLPASIETLHLSIAPSPRKSNALTNTSTPFKASTIVFFSAS
jgi:hypothetical protein